MFQRELGVVRPTIGFVRLGYFDSCKPYRSSVGKPHGPAINVNFRLNAFVRLSGRLIGAIPERGGVVARQPVADFAAIEMA